MIHTNPQVFYFTSTVHCYTKYYTWVYGDFLVKGGAEGLICPKFYTFFLLCPNLGGNLEGQLPPCPPDSYAHGTTYAVHSYTKAVCTSWDVCPLLPNFCGLIIKGMKLCKDICHFTPLTGFRQSWCHLNIYVPSPTKQGSSTQPWS